MSAPSSYQRVALFALWIVLALCPWRLAHADERVQFDIPGGPAGVTLPQYIAQTGLQVVFGYDDVRGISTNEIHGEFDVADALVRMTKGTRLQFEFITADAVTITVLPPHAARGSAIPKSPVLADGLMTDRRSLSAPLETVTVSTRQSRLSVHQLGSQLITLTTSDFEGFGFTTTQDVIRTLPQVFGGGPSEDTHNIGFEAQSNAGSGAGINLRGLGAGSTLVLVNGRRLAGGGSEGMFTDISSLPLAAIERFEILPDSSSSEYGADAVGGVVNFVLRDSFDRAQTSASYGTATSGSLHESQLSQLFGINSRLFDGVAAFDFYSRDALPAADRSLARSDLTKFGGSNFDITLSNPATIVLGSRTWAVPRGQDGSNLTVADLIPNQQNRENRYDQADLLPSQQRWSFYGSGKKAISDRVQLFTDVLFSDREVRNISGGARAPLLLTAINPFYVDVSGTSAPIQVLYDFAKDLGPLNVATDVRTLDVTTGTELRLTDAWRLTATASFASEHLRQRIDHTIDQVALAQALTDPNPETAFNPFGDGTHTNPATLARIDARTRFNSDSQLWSAGVTARRELPSLQQDAPSKLVMGVDYRRQAFASDALTPGGVQNLSHDLQRTAEAAFTTLSVPLMGKRTQDAQLNELEVSLAGRYEKYSDFGRIFTPRLAMTWAPLDALAVRGTWSRSFRPPNLLDLDESSNIVVPFPVQNPQAPNAPALVLVESGKNSQLHEERARSWTFGFDVQPVSLPGFSSALTYFSTTFKDRMNVPSFSTALLSDPSLVGLITLNPTAAQQQAACNSARYFGQPGTCTSLPIVGIADLRVRNSTFMRTNGIDLLAQYVQDSAADTITYKLTGTYILSFAEAQTALLPLSEEVSTQNHPIDLRVVGSVDWRHGPFRSVALVTYMDGYRDIASVPHRSVRSWTTLDLDVSYTPDWRASGLFSDTTFSLSADNVLNRNPPFLNNAIGIGYDQENGDLMGRIVSFSVRKTW